jgi:peptidyl-prolyl cis-trans isomerase B (cyclophilin B)
MAKFFHFMPLFSPLKFFFCFLLVGGEFFRTFAQNIKNMQKNKILFVLILFLFASAVSTQARKKEKRAVVRIETSSGVIRVALFDETPLHRDNFLKLASQGFYDGTLFHRCIKDFMIQGGDPESRTAKKGQLLGEGNPGYEIPAEFCLPYIYHWRGALAAAREPDDVNPEQNSSGCQFYIVYGKKQTPGDIRKARSMLEEKGIEITAQMSDDYQMRGGTPHLDGQYTVFGEVIEGLDIVKQIQAVATDKNDRPLEDVVVLKMTVEQYSKNKK